MKCVSKVASSSAFLSLLSVLLHFHMLQVSLYSSEASYNCICEPDYKTHADHLDSVRYPTTLADSEKRNSVFLILFLVSQKLLLL